MSISILLLALSSPANLREVMTKLFEFTQDQIRLRMILLMEKIRKARCKLRPTPSTLDYSPHSKTR